MIDKVDYKAGSISGYNTKHGNGVHIIRFTVTVRQFGDNVVVQAIALQVPNPGSYSQSQERNPINDPQAYQNFFAALSRIVLLLRN